VSRRLVGVLLSALPLLLGASASDPRGDTVACRGRAEAGGDVIDLLGADAQATEGGGAIRFTMTFAAPLPVPDREGRPFRVDVLVRDPEVPTVSFAYYRGVNRIVRFDAIAEPALTILLLAERGSNSFFGASVEGARLVMELPGRLLTRDVDLEGPALERLTWSVVARDEGTCDFLGDGRPTNSVAPAEAILPPLDPPGDRPDEVPIGWIMLIAVAGIAIGGTVYVWIGRRREATR
jgi:hypothetical protein